MKKPGAVVAWVMRIARWRIRALGLTLLALASFGLACGSDEVSDDVAISLPEGSTPKAEYVSEINAICSSANRTMKERLEPALKEALAEDVPVQVAVYSALDEAKPILDRVIDRAIAIAPPEEDREELERHWSSLRDVYALIPSITQAVRDDDEEQLAEIGLEMRDEAGTAVRFTKEYGLDQCKGQLSAGTEDLFSPTSPTASPEATSQAGAGLPLALRRGLVRGCVSDGGSRSACSCVADELEQRVSTDDLLQAGLAAGKAPNSVPAPIRDSIEQAAHACRRAR